MKQYSYYDAYHRQRKFPMTIRLHRWRSKRGVFLLSFLLPCLGALFLVGGDHGGGRLEQDLSGTVGCQYQRQQEFFLVCGHTKK